MDKTITYSKDLEKELMKRTMLPIDKNIYKNIETLLTITNKIFEYKFNNIYGIDIHKNFYWQNLKGHNDLSKITLENIKLHNSSENGMLKVSNFL